MLSKSLFLAAFTFGAIALGGDTPFLTYSCTCGHPAASYQFELQFHDDNSAEEVDWASPLNRTTVTFQKQSRDLVTVQMTDGLPVLAQTTPQHFSFSAPLSTDQFNFAMGVDPLTIHGGDMLNLTCVREKPENESASRR
jgi:hypothetical protein